MPGVRPEPVLAREADAIFVNPLNGKSVLDIGAWDGFFSFEAEKRGAASVLSTDHFCWSGPGWGTKAGYDFAHSALRSNCDSYDVDVFDLDPDKLGTFNVVLFLGVLYHLTNPYGGLEKAAAMADELLIVETVTAQNHNPDAVLQYFENDSLSDDPTNFFAPNTKALCGMLRELGFSRIEVKQNREKKANWRKRLKKRLGLAKGPERHIAFAWRE